MGVTLVVEGPEDPPPFDCEVVDDVELQRSSTQLCCRRSSTFV